MRPESWQRVKELFEGAAALEGAEREAFLRGAREDAEVLREVASLIASHDRAGDFIQRPAMELLPTLPRADEAQAGVGALLGAYRITGIVGRGGMGMVYRAVRADERYEKQVAIKLVKQGLDTNLALARFEAERRILARLDHPGIARLLDAGTAPDGRPYFVMELVEGGRPIDTYVAEERLDVRRRLELFRSVCDAVQYAHRNLVVHRDIKPGNILVTADGAPKLLDFGIAKLLDPGSLGDDTATAQRLMTPEYASPEQLRGEPVTTSSDVYALGLVLYLLLAERQPYRLSTLSPAEVKAACEEEPQLPSAVAASGGNASLARLLAGDLDTIVMAALRKEPERRYASTERLSEDIARHLAGLPVGARRDTFRYRAGKFVGRNPVAFTASLLLLVSLVGGIVATIHEARVARRERERAEKRFSDLRRLSNSFLFEFHDAIADIPGTTKARELIVRKALEYLDGLAAEAGADASLQRELALAYEKVGDVQGREGRPNLGDTAGALVSYRKSAAILDAVLAAAPGGRASRLDRARVGNRVGQTLIKTGDLRGALDSHLHSGALAEGLAREDPGSPAVLQELGASLNTAGFVQARVGRTATAIESYRKAVRVSETWLALEPGSPDARRALGRNCLGLSDCLYKMGDLRGALASVERTLALSEESAAADPTSASMRRQVAFGHERVGFVRFALGDRPGSLEDYRKALAIYTELSSADPRNAEAQRDVMVTCTLLGSALTEAGDLAAAREAHARAIQLAAVLSARDPSNVQALRDLAVAHQGMGRLQVRAGAATAGAGSFRTALDILERLAGADPRNVQARADEAEVQADMSRALLASGDAAAALLAQDTARKTLEELTAADPKSGEVRLGLADAYASLGVIHARLAAGAPSGSSGEPWSAAAAAYRQALGVYSEMQVKGTLPPARAADLGPLADKITFCEVQARRRRAR